jgi:hypothetical protein
MVGNPWNTLKSIFFSLTWRGVSTLHNFEIEREMEMRRMRCCAEKTPGIHVLRYEVLTEV